MAGEKILVVEDNPLNMELMADLLELAGYPVIQATTAEEGIRLARSESPSLILMDIGLPGMNGFEATRLLGKDSNTKNIPVIAITSHAMKGDDKKAFEAGCCKYLTKPIDTRTFPKEVAECLSHFSSV